MRSNEVYSAEERNPPLVDHVRRVRQPSDAAAHPRRVRDSSVRVRKTETCAGP